MKILLIAPSVKDKASSRIPDGISKVLSQNVGVYPPLGLAYVAAILRRGGHDVTIIDSLAQGLSLEETASKAVSIGPDMIGLTGMSFTFLYALELARLIKAKRDIPIIIGGDHVSVYPKEVMTHQCFDYGVFGEGDYTFLDIADAMDEGKDVTGIKGILYRKGGKLAMTPKRAMIDDLDKLPFPARDLLDIKRYYTCNLPSPFTSLITSRGCPYRCTFCSKTSFGNSFRYHSAKRVVDEIEHCINEYGIKGFDIFDDTFTMDMERAREIIRLVKKRGLKFSFSFLTRVDRVDKEMLKGFAEIGCKTIAYGIETGDPKMLKSLKKGFTLDQIRQALEWTREAGIESFGMVMIGFPGETHESIRNTIDFIKEVRPGFVKCNIMCPYPGSPLYDSFVKEGKIDDFWRDVTIKGRLEGKMPLFNDMIPRSDLVKYRNSINRMNYIRARSNIFKIHKIHNLQDIRRSLAIIIEGYLEKDV